MRYPGPLGLRLVTDAESIHHFAEIGVVLMLFVIGLGSWIRNVCGNCGHRCSAAVRYKMVVCGGLIGLFCMFLGLRWQVAELIGMTLALSSTAVAMQAMNERNLMVSQMAQRVCRAAVPGYRRYSIGGDDPVTGGERRIDYAWGVCIVSPGRRGRTGIEWWYWGVMSRPATFCCAFGPAGSIQCRCAVPRVWLRSAPGRGWPVDGDGGPFWPECCWQALSIATRWKATLSHLKDCCWDCFHWRGDVYRLWYAD